MKKILKSILHPAIVLGFTLLILFPLFSNRLLYSDDAELHAARVANYYLAVKQGQIPPRLAPNLDSGYGSPVFNFTYPLPYIISTLIFMVLPVTIVMALNLTIILLTVTGVLGIYYLAKKFNLTSWQSSLASILYLTAPYTLVNIYSRTALGEIAFFAFLPWVMWEIEHFIRDKKVKLVISLALIIYLALLITSHQTSVVITFPVLACYYLIRSQNKKQRLTLIKRIIPIGIISILLTAWYWLPALLEKQFIILDRGDTITNYLTQFPQHLSFFFHKVKNINRLNTFKMTTIGYNSWILVLTAFWFSKKKKLADQKILWYLLGTVGLTTVLMMPFSRPLWLVSGLGNYLQYPWRLISILTLTTVLIYLHLLQTKSLKKNHLLTILLIITSILSTVAYAKPRGFQTWSDYELFEYFKTTTTFNEFQPIWAAEYTRHFPEEKISFRTPAQKLYEDEILQPADYTKLDIQNWYGSAMSYKIKTDQEVEVIQKTYYFPGWELIINNQPHEIIYQDDEFPGHITYSLEPGEHQINLLFTQDTLARKIGNYLTFLGLFLGILYHLQSTKPRR